MTDPTFTPHVPATESPPELTFRAIVLGAILGIVFGAASTYLALRVGLTVSASVPCAVIAIALLRRRGGQRAILEHNVTQTAASAGESVASAMVFTVPALIFLGYPLEVGLSTMIALTGGMLGVLMMVPLRRYLIVKEHGKLRYPEGKAAAEILIAGEEGGASAKKVFLGGLVGVAFQYLVKVAIGVKAMVAQPLSAIAGSIAGWFGAANPAADSTFMKSSALSCSVEPPLFGVGYIIGYRISVIMVAGSLLSTLVLIPVIAFFGQHIHTVVAPGIVPIGEMSADDIWKNYVRYIGAGAVATGGIIGLIRALPAIVTSLAASLKALGGGGKASNARTDRDTPAGLLLLGALAIVGTIWAVPMFHMSLLGAVLILALGFLFAVVSARITGEVGSSSCPLSGMTIGVLMAVCGAFLYQGHAGDAYSRLALIIGAVVCVAISNAGTCSQDLKTGYLVGSTPVRQQGALLIGVICSVLAVGWTAYLLNLSESREEPVAKAFVLPVERIDSAESVSGLTNKSATFKYVRVRDAEIEGVPGGNYLFDATTHEPKFRRIDGIGYGALNAPQAKLMSIVIDGLLNRRLPWDLILLGAAIALFVELLGFGSLTFAVGVYLPLDSTMPVYLGGLVRKLADKFYGRMPDAEEEPHGVLFSSGLIAGASILGILSAMQTFMNGYDKDGGFHPSFAFLRGKEFLGLDLANSDLWALIVMALLMLLMFVAARGRNKPIVQKAELKPLDEAKPEHE